MSCCYRRMEVPVMAEELVVVHVTFPDAESALETAEKLVRERLVACCNVVGGVESVYVWQGELHRKKEVLCEMKTVVDRVAELEHRLQELHPYEVPEFVVIDVMHSAPAYLKWVCECTSKQE